MQTLTKELVIEAENHLLAAMCASNVEALDHILHDGLLFLTPAGTTLTKQIDLDAHRSGSMVIEKIIPAIEAISIVEDSAVVVLVYQTKGVMLGAPIEGTFRYTRVWKWLEGRLQVIGGACYKVE